MPSGKNSRPSLLLQDRDLAIFRGLFESRLMTLGHIARLYFDGRSEAAKKRIQGLKSARYLGERSRRVYEPSILYLRERAFIELSERGEVCEYPRFTWEQLKKRLQVSDSTLRHELAVLIRPDGFMRIYEHTNEGDAFEHFLYLEVDRSTEPRETLALRTYGYQDYYRRGGLAVRYGAPPEEYQKFPFRVLMVVPNDERRNNMAERLLQNTPPILSMVWLTTFAEITTDPLGHIWMRPLDYRDITKGTAYDPSRPRTGSYRRQPEREALVAGEVKKQRLL